MIKTLPTHLNPSKNNSNGFTLIELLVVVAIIGVLSAIVASIIKVEEYNRQARDARRLNDIITLQTALTGALTLNQIRLTTTNGCSNCDSISGTSKVDGTGWVLLDNVSNRGLSDFLQSLPFDPVNENNLKYIYYSNGQEYELNTVLESEKYQIYAQNDNGTDAGIYERGLRLDIR